jgi:hypothetical protein
VELEDQVEADQRYLANSAVLSTRLTDEQGGVVEITDFVPRFRQYGRMFTPVMLIRKIKRVEGTPRSTWEMMSPMRTCSDWMETISSP